MCIKDCCRESERGVFVVNLTLKKERSGILSCVLSSFSVVGPVVPCEEPSPYLSLVSRGFLSGVDFWKNRNG